MSSERSRAAQVSVATILSLLGPEATEKDAKHVQSIIEHSYPGVSIDRIPDETWTWVRTGHGSAPRIAQMPASATGLMDLYESMSDTRRAELLEIAKVLRSSDRATGFATTQAANFG